MWASFWWWCIIFISLGSFFRSWLRELSPKSSVPSGGGIMRQPGQAGQSFTFIINLKDNGGRDYVKPLAQGLQVEISGAATLVPTVTHHRAGAYEVAYMARRAGTYRITLWANGKRLGRSPYSVEITPGPIDPKCCKLTEGPGLCSLALLSNQRTHVIVSTYDAFDNKRMTGGPATFELSAQNSEITIDRLSSLKVSDQGDGSYNISFAPHEGLSQMSLSCNGELIQNGEWFLNVLTPNEMKEYHQNCEKKRFFFKAQHDGSSVWIYLTERQVAIYSYALFLVPRRLTAVRLSRHLKVDWTPSTSFQIDFEDGQPAWAFSTKNLNVFYATLAAFLHRDISYEQRYRVFANELRPVEPTRSTLSLTFKRSNLLQNLLELERRLTIGQWKCNWMIRFEGEPGFDAGGLLRELFTVMSREVFCGEHGLFAPLDPQNTACGVHPCPSKLRLEARKHSSGVREQKWRSFWSIKHSSTAASTDDQTEREKENKMLRMYKACGLLIGKVLWDSAVFEKQHLVDVHFTRSFRKQLLGLPPHFTDWQTDDPQFYLSKVKYLLENDPADLEITFTEEVFGEDGTLVQQVELKPGGRNIVVNKTNCRAYLLLLADYRLRESVGERINAFKEGFHSLIPEQLISMFDENELELLISGMPTIDFDKLKASVRYSLWSPSDEVVQWFWAAVESFNDGERTRLLQFITGSSQLPSGGFQALNPPIIISKSYAQTDSLPQAATCFNRLNLPNYSSFAKLQERLLYGINEGSEGFGFA